MDILPRDEWIRTLPRKITAALALLRNEQGEILIVKATYKDGWGVPGGIVEAFESPRAGCIREVQEEIGLDVTIDRLLVVDYSKIKEDIVDFVFDGGVFSEERIAHIRLQSDELSEYRFVDREAAQHLLSPTIKIQMNLALEALQEKNTIYFESAAE